MVTMTSSVVVVSATGVDSFFDGVEHSASSAASTITTLATIGRGGTTSVDIVQLTLAGWWWSVAIPIVSQGAFRSVGLLVAVIAVSPFHGVASNPWGGWWCNGGTAVVSVGGNVCIDGGGGDSGDGDDDPPKSSWSSI